MSEQITVGELIDFLTKTYKPDDKLCYWHEGGAWLECEPLYKSELGKTFLKTVKQDKDERRGFLDENELENDYRLVKDSDIIVY